jgi:hypothetical protein
MCSAMDFVSSRALRASVQAKGLIANIMEHCVCSIFIGEWISSPMKMEYTQCSETSAVKHHTPGNNPKRLHATRNLSCLLWPILNQCNSVHTSKFGLILIEAFHLSLFSYISQTHFMLHFCQCKFYACFGLHHVLFVTTFIHWVTSTDCEPRNSWNFCFC